MKEFDGGRADETTLVSICIPTYNNEEYIGRTIASIIEQTYQNWELVIVDDNSSDGTTAQIQQFTDGRIRVFQNACNLGMSGNWNRCLSLAQGTYIKLICADDILHPECIKKEAAVLDADETVVLVESDTNLIDIDGVKKGEFHRYFKKGRMDGKKLAKISIMLNNFFGAPCNNMFRKLTIEQCGGFDSAFTYILDFDLWITIACTGQVYLIHECLNSFRIRQDSNTGDMIHNNQDVYVEEHRRLVEKHAASGILSISPFECKISVLLRRLRNKLIRIYLKICAK